MNTFQNILIGTFVGKKNLLSLYETAYLLEIRKYFVTENIL